MRRRVLKLMLVVAVVLLMSAPSVCSEQTSSPEVEIEVNVPKALATSVTLSMIDQGVWGPPRGPLLISWSAAGDLVLDPVNHIFTTDHYYAIEVGGDNSWTAIFATTQVSGPGGSLNGNIKISAFKMHKVGGVDDPISWWDGNLNNLNTFTCVKARDIPSGYWLRVLVQIPNEHGDGTRGAWDPIPETQAGGSYTGTITVTYTG